MQWSHKRTQIPRRAPDRHRRVWWLMLLALIGQPMTSLASVPAAVPADVPADPPQYIVDVRLVVDGLVSPVALAEPPDQSRRLFIADQIGVIHIVMPDGGLHPTPFLDLRSTSQVLPYKADERGLLGFALHPDYFNTGRFYVYYSAVLRHDAPKGWNHTARLAEFTVFNHDPNAADPASERILLEIDQPQANHNGGGLAFGPDGYLYLALGDGGGALDAGIGHARCGNGQDVTANLLGSILRLDVDRGDPYAIPPDNPFIGTTGRDEIFAFGFRNPYRISFDLDGAHELFVGDTGEHTWEEINRVVSGGNYGWNQREGRHFVTVASGDTDANECRTSVALHHPFFDPILEYANAAQPGGLGHAVIGGYVYRGKALSMLQGAYIFGDWSTSWNAADGTLFVARPSPNEVGWSIQELALAGGPTHRLGAFILGFGQDAAGEIYVLAAGQRRHPERPAGAVYKLVPVAATTP